MHHGNAARVLPNSTNPSLLFRKTSGSECDKGPRLNSTPADEHTFLELVNENRSRILRVCRVYAWNSADQDDLYQEILFQIWRGLPTLKEKQFASTWLYRVALNTAMSFARKRAAG